MGTKVGIDEQPVYSNVLRQMEQDKLNHIDVSYVRKCIQANY